MNDDFDANNNNGGSYDNLGEDDIEKYIVEGRNRRFLGFYNNPMRSHNILQLKEVFLVMATNGGQVVVDEESLSFANRVQPFSSTPSSRHICNSHIFPFLALNRLNF
ncbi:hypothetical protein OSB04_008129 [Centaurea solstitialis]|uniref:Uncharacterized protein n=1 Tax=Centaurea solstitialis TaxID=347529 RepID=A0AA38WSZ4_9ASTR|nr:hypothetical protein OSB04_008129 [Centaurea solstitialis]